MERCQAQSGTAAREQKIEPRRKGRAAPEKVTLTKVAQAADVSPMTVSNYVNGKFHFMSETTRERVAEAVRQLNYRPDTAARSLRSARQLSIGLIIVDESPLYLSDGFTTQVVSGLGNHLNAKGYTLQLEGLRGRDFGDSSLIRHVRTDGLCVMLSGGDAVRRSLLDRVASLNQPFVVFLETAPRAHEDVCCVMQDDRKGGALLARHLLERGARRLLFLTQTHNYWKAVEERRKGLAAEVARFGAGAALRTIGCGSGNVLETQAAVARAITNEGLPDAILGASDQIGIAALKLVKSMGIEVPDQVMITGFNAFDFWQCSDPLLTTVRSPGYELGQIAGRERISARLSGLSPFGA